MGQITGKIWAVVFAAVFFKAAGDVDPRETLRAGQLDVRVSLVIAEQDVEAGLLLLDQVIFKRQSLFFIVHHNVLNVQRLAQQ